MQFAQRRAFNISLLLVLCLLFAPFVDAAELSLFDKLKLKTQKKADELQQREWWITKAAGKVAGFVAGKAGGAIGAAAGYVLGAAVGGPVAAGMGAMIGFRIGDIVTKTFAKAVGELLAQWKLNHGRKVDLSAVVDAVKTVNKASLTAESIGAVIGDLVGGSLGAAAGIALLAGCGPIALPIIGTMSVAYLGSKLGKAIGGGIGRWIGRKVLKKGYEAYATSDDQEVEEQPEVTLVKIEDPLSHKSEDLVASATPLLLSVSNASDARSAYEKAYRDYTDMITSPDASDADKKASLHAYRQAYELYRVSISAADAAR
ncbi:MAG: hypothetical protein EOM80_01840 [Erysipelotrichia bacterium]|nr:hypothetical protein [Erysipelotrichia bacterium]